MKNYLVTGAAGFIGSYIAKYLIKSGASVYVIDNLSTGIEDNIPREAKVEIGNCYDESIINRFSSVQFDAIFHIAGQSSGEISFDDPVYDLNTNTESTLLLIKFGLEHHCKRFLYASTMSVYGTVEDKPISESHSTFPLSFYGVGKLASEHYLRIYCSKGLQPTTLRLFNVYGPGQNMNNMRQGMVSIFMSYILKNQPLHIKGSKDRFRDFIFIDDVVSAFITCLAYNETIGKVYNVGTGKKTYIHELVENIIRSFGSSVDNYPHFYKDSTPGDQFGIYCDNSLLRKDTNWSPNVSLVKGVQLMADWCKTIS